MSAEWWRIPREWEGETAFIIAGGTSVADQDTDQLKGRKVIAINRSWERIPFANFLFFGDDRWWREFGSEVLARFPGRIVTCAPGVKHERFLKLKKLKPDIGLSADPSEVMVRRTSLTGALNLAWHLGAEPIVLLGADGKRGANGRLHHHAEYDGAMANEVSTIWTEQRTDLTGAAEVLKAAGVRVVNASPGSALADLWPIVDLKDYL